MHPNETKIYIALLIVAASLVMIIGIFTLTILRHRRRALRLYREKVAAEITTLENERRRIATDLHDDFGPHMSAIKLQLAAIDVKTAEDEALLTTAQRHIDEMVNKIRTTSNNLVPLVLERKGFNAALDQFVGSINETRQLAIRLDRQTERQPAPATAIHLYRMINEMVNNTIKHAQATTCKISIRDLGEGGMQYTIQDNGVGFDYQQLSRMSLGFGLQNILSRAEILRASIYIEARPGHGVKYTIELPNNAYEQ